MSDRHTFRAEWHDYNSGIYFVTICSKDKQHIFGRIENGIMIMSDIGKIINECLTSIPNHHKDVELWNHVVMPNHIHIVLVVGAQYFAPAQSVPAQSNAYPAESIQNIGCLRPPRHGEPRYDNHFNSRLAVIIRSFKAACSIEINRQLQLQNIAPLRQIWQRNYHEHIIRNQQAFEIIMNYIETNIEKWNQDCFYTN